jgi:hypothetical protein
MYSQAVDTELPNFESSQPAKPAFPIKYLEYDLMIAPKHRF